jgi:hypothetical protein
MKIEFIEDISLALRKSFEGRVTKYRRFKRGEVRQIEFLSEDLDAETIDFQFEDCPLALGVTRTVVAMQK